jgi:alkyl hydroperoxide reductase subunit F
VLIVGGGPPARRRRSTPRARASAPACAERFGGQVLDTMAIENFISVKDTEGPKLAAALERT